MPEGAVLNPPPGDVAYLTIEQVAEMSGRTVQGLYIGRHRDLPPGNLGVRYLGRLWFRLSDVESWLREELDQQFDARWRRRNDARKEPVITEARRLADEAKGAANE